METKTGQGLHRREFLKTMPLGAFAAGLTVAAAPGEAVAAKAADELKKTRTKVHDEFPIPVKDDYQPALCYRNIFGPGLIEAAGRKFGVPFSVLERMGPQLRLKPRDCIQDIRTFGSFLQKLNYQFDPGTPGHDQLCKALTSGAWGLINNTCGPASACISDYGLMRWTQRTDKNPFDLSEHDWVAEQHYDFESETFAAAAIKRAARLYGADLVGITRRDPRWDYANFFNPIPPMGRDAFTPLPSPAELPQMGANIAAMLQQWTPDKWFFDWRQFPFEPKTVIVLGFEMNYEGISASPGEVAGAAVGAGYSRMAKASHQLKVFLKQLGYHAVSCCNDTALSVPYAVAAGLGEPGRNGLLVNYKYGPRLRLAKVYTDFDFVAYDRPQTFGVQEFCKNCKRCAEACPSKAISFDPEPSYEPTHEDKATAYFNNPGTLKWYANTRKCFQFWEKNGVDCSNCITSCPYNKPDFWHHRLVRKMGRVRIDPLHGFLREMDILFGYGNTFDDRAVDRFFENHGNREYNGGL